MDDTIEAIAYLTIAVMLFGAGFLVGSAMVEDSVNRECSVNYMNKCEVCDQTEHIKRCEIHMVYE